MKLEFIPLREEFFPVLLRWLSEGHVREWWDEGENTLEKVVANYGPEEGLSRYVLWYSASDDEIPKPIGFFQHYGMPDGSIGIDQFIGIPDLIGKGIGTKAVIAFTEMIFKEHSPPFIFLDPHPDNLRAIRCYEKAGFREFESRTGQTGDPVTIMRLFPAKEDSLEKDRS